MSRHQVTVTATVKEMPRQQKTTMEFKEVAVEQPVQVDTYQGLAIGMAFGLIVTSVLGIITYFIVYRREKNRRGSKSV